MATNLDRFREELTELIEAGNRLRFGMWREYLGDAHFREGVEEGRGAPLTDEELDEMSLRFRPNYERWYSKADAVVKQVLPDRIEDFRQLYRMPRRTKFDVSTYRLADYVVGTTLTGKDLAGHAGSLFDQQLSIVVAASDRLDSALHDLAALAQADVFDSELESANELKNKKFFRAAGIVAGVVVERHLAQVCAAHGVKVPGKRSTIASYNLALKKAGTIDQKTSRFIEFLGDIRNDCSHERAEPEPDDIADLIAGADKVIKTVS